MVLWQRSALLKVVQELVGLYHLSAVGRLSLSSGSSGLAEALATEASAVALKVQSGSKGSGSHSTLVRHMLRSSGRVSGEF